MTPTAIAEAIRERLSPALLNPTYAKLRPATAPNSWGCCYVASEAAYHLLGGRAAGWKPVNTRHEGSQHWWLERDGEVLDLTADQFATPVPYQAGIGRGFLTALPSRRAQRLIDSL